MFSNWNPWLILLIYGLLIIGLLSIMAYSIRRDMAIKGLADEIMHVQIEVALTLLQITYAEQRGEDSTKLMEKLTGLKEELEGLTKKAAKVFKR